MKLYTVSYSNFNDSRTVIEATEWQKALEIYTDTKEHRRFFQDEQSIDEKNSGIVTLTCDNTDKVIFSGRCKKVK